MSIDHLAFAERVKIGTERECRIADCLNKYHGWQLEAVPSQVDMEEKIDFIERGKVKVQIKSRDENSGADMLYDLFEPWRGSIEKSTIGRDHLSDFGAFVCLTRDGQWIRVAEGRAFKKIVNDCYGEWQLQGCKFPLGIGKAWESEKYEGVQFRIHKDNKNGRFKVLAFLPDSVFGPKEFKKYKMVTT